ncbi:fatty acid desaturase [Bauldia litoralis]|uniref:Omega-6 fatty acid desaturase (Delta-12 desaturase) n=1 Tax=Bauldia litoralis TaxID=665467 RepID=A0A1G6CNG6_9HYPH|nr:fatty acid desaturase [Bauldia litoralis]SDB34388.1 omega-6 fatty acid desaturase (delta-12 desaturase) [Bauldia litoralis]
MNARTVDESALRKTLARCREPSPLRSIVEIVITAVPFIALWATMWAALTFVGVWLTLLLAIPAAGFLVRLFLIQHDCGHDSFFRRRVTNDWVGRVIGVLTFTPYDYWRRRHAAHHATSGNLDSRGIGDVTTLTVDEYLERGRWGRLLYWLSRHPAVLFGLGPGYLFILEQRLPIGLMRAGWSPWVSTMATNAAILAIAAGLMWLIGVGPFLIIQLPILIFAATIGVWLFFVQHQFEETHWEKAGDWRHSEAALHGSSHYDLPGVLRWFSANIGIHHVHHLASRIPYYRLPEVLRSHPELHDLGRLTFWQSFACVRLALWDEGNRRLISFRDLRRQTAAGLRQRAALSTPGESAAGA